MVLPLEHVGHADLALKRLREDAVPDGPAGGVPVFVQRPHHPLLGLEDDVVRAGERAFEVFQLLGGDLHPALLLVLPVLAHELLPDPPEGVFEVEVAGAEALEEVDEVGGLPVHRIGVGEEVDGAPQHVLPVRVDPLQVLRDLAQLQVGNLGSPEVADVEDPLLQTVVLRDRLLGVLVARLKHQRVVPGAGQALVGGEVGLDGAEVLRGRLDPEFEFRDGDGARRDEVEFQGLLQDVLFKDADQQLLDDAARVAVVQVRQGVRGRELAEPHRQGAARVHPLQGGFKRPEVLSGQRFVQVKLDDVQLRRDQVFVWTHNCSFPLMRKLFNC